MSGPWGGKYEFLRLSLFTENGTVLFVGDMVILNYLLLFIIAIKYKYASIHS